MLFERTCSFIIYYAFNVIYNFQAGWGRNEDDQLNEQVFPRQVFLNAVNDTECFIKYRDLNRGASHNTFCAGGDNAGPCDGDSGLLIQTLQMLTQK